MAKALGIFLCLLILIMDIAAGILGYMADKAQNEGKHLKFWLFECKKPSEKAYMLGWGAVALLGVAHLMLNLMACCSYLRSRRDTSKRQPSMKCLLLTWVVLGVGMWMLVTATRANYKSSGSCGFSNQLFFYGAIACVVHAFFSGFYYLSASAFI